MDNRDTQGYQVKEEKLVHVDLEALEVEEDPKVNKGRKVIQDNQVHQDPKEK